MKHYNFKPISNDKIVIDVNILDINIKNDNGRIHILPSFTLIYNTTIGYYILDLNWLMFELKIYNFYKYIKNKLEK